MSDTPKFDQSIPTDVAAHIRAIVSEFWDKEEADYHDNPSPGHPFESLRAVDRRMRAATPDAETPESDPNELPEPGDPIATMLADLYTAATDAEAAVFDELTRRTGYIWVCGEEACGGWRNPGHAATCGSCGTPRPERDATTPEDPHARHGHIENQAVAWNSDLAQVALFTPPHGSAFVLFAHTDLRPRLCQFTNALMARELFERIVGRWKVSHQLEEMLGD